MELTPPCRSDEMSFDILVIGLKAEAGDEVRCGLVSVYREVRLKEGDFGDAFSKMSSLTLHDSCMPLPILESCYRFHT